MQKELDLFLKLSNKLIEAELNDPVVEPIPVEELRQNFDIALSDEPVSDSYFAETLEKIVLNTPRTASVSFFNQLFGGRSPKATLGDLLAVMLNNSMYTYKVAGPQVGIEKEIVDQIATRAGFASSYGGTITSGGSMSNLVAMLMARDRKDRKSSGQGKKDQILTAYTSEASHYSLKKAASILGVGSDWLRKVPADKFGKMDAQKLEESITSDLKEGYTPFFINCTAGTTVLGAFDPIRELTAISKRHGLWIHVDGAYCGSVIFSERHRTLLDGLSEVDSFNLNAHKMLGTPLTCSIIVTQDKANLYHSLSAEAEYLYQSDEDEYNLGKTSLQCGRRNNALKFWCLWKSVGTKGLGQIVDTQFDLASHAREYVRAHEDYTLYSYDDSISVCFNYKDIDPIELCTSLHREADLLVGYGTFEGETFIRLVTMDPRNTSAEIDRFFRILEAHAQEHYISKEVSEA